MSLQDFRTHVDQSCRYSEEFVNIYYDCMDKKRRVSDDRVTVEIWGEGRSVHYQRYVYNTN